MIKVYKTKNNKWCAIVELNPESFEKCMDSKRLKVRWTVCRVTQELNVFQCFKCNGYNHKQINCTNKVTCRFCALDLYVDLKKRNVLTV